MHISPNNRNAIHPGDRILEINGTPVRTLRVEEVECRFSLSGGLGHGAVRLEDQTAAFTFPTPSLSVLARSLWPLVTSEVNLAHSWGSKDGLIDGGADRMPGRGYCGAASSWRPPLAKLSIGHTVFGSPGLMVGGLGWDSLWEPA